MSEHGHEPPHNTDHERALLGCLLLAARNQWSGREDDIDRVVETLAVEAFYWPQYGSIYAAIRSLRHSGAPVSVATILEWLDTNQRTFEEARSVLTSLWDSMPTATGLLWYVDKVKGYAKLRDLDAAGAEIRGIVASRTLSPDEAIAAAEKRIFASASAGGPAASETSRDLRSLIAAETEAIEERERSGVALSGLSTGFPALDRILLGMGPGDFILLAGRPGMGKSAVGVAIGVNVAKAGGKVAVFSLEMPAPSLTRRIIAAESGVPLSHIRTGQGANGPGDRDFDESDTGLSRKQWEAIGQAQETLYDCDLRIDDTPRLCPSMLASKARRLRAEMGGLDLVVVDHFHKMRGEPGVRYNGETEELSAIARALQGTVRELGCPGLVLAQLSRSVERREDKRPMMSDLRGSGALEEEADVIAFVYRASYYERSEGVGADGGPEQSSEPDRDEIEVLVEKSRNGETAYCKVDFLPHTTGVEPWCQR